jgi:hypothetical protein
VIWEFEPVFAINRPGKIVNYLLCYFGQDGGGKMKKHHTKAEVQYYERQDESARFL